MHRGAFCQFPFRWIYYCHSGKSTAKETGKTHFCALHICALCTSLTQQLGKFLGFFLWMVFLLNLSNVIIMGFQKKSGFEDFHDFPQRQLSRALRNGPFCQFFFRWIYCYGITKANRKETGKWHLCALVHGLIYLP